MPYETFTKVIGPKVHGTWNLHNATLNQPLDFFVLLASAAGTIGDLSQGNYAAANAFQDSFAYYRTSRGLPATVVDLGMIRSVGYVAETEGATQNNLSRWGFVLIDEEEFLAMMSIAVEGSNINDGEKRCQFVTGLGTQAYFDRTQHEIPHWFNEPVFSHLRMMRARTVGAKTDVEVSLVQQLEEATSIDAAAAIVVDALLKKLSKALMIPLEDIHAASPTSAYGVDSLVAVEVRNWLLREFKADIPVFDILQAPSLQLVGYKVVEKSGLLSEKFTRAED